MKATVTVQSLYELTQVANYSGKKVDQSKPLVFPMPVFTEIDALPHAKSELTFEELEQKYLKK